MLRLRDYIPALLTAIVWGSTFVASKHVIDAGVSPVALMTIRFIVAYLLLLLWNHERMHIGWNLTELKLLALGLCGGSFYFLLEYMALKYTSAVNVGLICATVPVISTAIDLLLKSEKPRPTFIVGSLMAFFGVLLLVTDGKLLIDIFPLGDALAIGSSILWAVYTVVLGRIGKGMKEVVIERRMMFYSFVTILPVALLLVEKSELTKVLMTTDVLLSTLYLSAVASAGCLWLWNVSINRIGIVKTNNFLYLLPVVSLLASACLMDNEVTAITVGASLLILLGIVVADL